MVLNKVGGSFWTDLTGSCCEMPILVIYILWWFTHSVLHQLQWITNFAGTYLVCSGGSYALVAHILW